MEILMFTLTGKSEDESSLIGTIHSSQVFVNRMASSLH